MGNIKSVGLSEKFKAHQIKRILYMRDAADPPVTWLDIGRSLNIGVLKVRKLYEEAKLGE